MCEMGEENLTHVLREYQLTRSNMQVKEFLNEKGEGLELMRKMEQQRKSKEDKPGGGDRRGSDENKDKD